MKLNWDYNRLGDRSVQRQFAKNVSVDPYFFQLDTFHNAEAVLSYLNPPLQEAGQPWAKSCQILKVGYVCKRQLMVIYRLSSDLMNADGLIVVVHFFREDKSRLGYKVFKETASNQNAVIHIPKWSAVAIVFPEDSALPSLHNMLNFKSVAQSIERITGKAVDQKEISWSLMSYQPGKRCSIRFQLPDKVFICKLEGQKASVRTHTLMRKLWEMRDRCFDMPKPLGLFRVEGLRWESFLEGEPVGPNISKVDLVSLVKAVSIGMSQFHKVSLEGLRQLGCTEILREMESKTVRKLCRSLVPLTSEIETFYKELVCSAVSFSPGPSVTLHGDAHTANLLFDGDRIVFIDLDALVAGHPAYDLARFGNRLLLMALMEDDRIGEVRNMVSLLPEAYENAGGCHIPKNVFAWYLSALLINKELMACIKNRASDLGRLSPILIDIARRTLVNGEISLA